MDGNLHTKELHPQVLNVAKTITKDIKKHQRLKSKAANPIE